MPGAATPVNILVNLQVENRKTSTVVIKGAMAFCLSVMDKGRMMPHNPFATAMLLQSSIRAKSKK